MRPKLQKHSTLKLAGRIIPLNGGNAPQLAVEHSHESSGARGSHPRALPKLDVTVSRHPAPIVQPKFERAANGQKVSVAFALCTATREKPDSYVLSIFCISGMPSELDYCSKVERSGKELTCGSVRNN